MSESTTTPAAGLPDTPDPLAAMLQRSYVESARRFTAEEINGPKWAQTLREASHPAIAYARALGTAGEYVSELVKIIDALVAEIQTGHQS